MFKTQHTETPRELKPAAIFVCLTLYLLWFKFVLDLNFIFLLFLGMVKYDNEFEKNGK